MSTDAAVLAALDFTPTVPCGWRSGCVQPARWHGRLTCDADHAWGCFCYLHRALIDWAYLVAPMCPAHRRDIPRPRLMWRPL